MLEELNDVGLRWIVTALARCLGEASLAYLAGLTRAETLHSWVHTPLRDPFSEQRVRLAFKAYVILETSPLKDANIRAWFMQGHRLLNDQWPIKAIKENCTEPEKVLLAAYHSRQKVLEQQVQFGKKHVLAIGPAS